MKPVNTNDSHIVLRASIKERKQYRICEAAIYNKEELCTKALCTYLLFSREGKRKKCTLNCEVEQDEYYL